MSHCNPLLKGQPRRKPALHPPSVSARCGHRLWPDPGSCPVGSADLHLAECQSSNARDMAGLSLPEGDQRLCGASPRHPRLAPNGEPSNRPTKRNGSGGSATSEVWNSKESAASEPPAKYPAGRAGGAIRTRRRVFIAARLAGVARPRPAGVRRQLTTGLALHHPKANEGNFAVDMQRGSASGNHPHPFRHGCIDDLAERCRAIRGPLSSPPRWTRVTIPRSGQSHPAGDSLGTHSCRLHAEEWWGSLGVRTLGTRLTGWAR